MVLPPGERNLNVPCPSQVICTPFTSIEAASCSQWAARARKQALRAAHQRVRCCQLYHARARLCIGYRRKRPRRFSVLAVALFDCGGLQFDEQMRHRQPGDAKQC